MNVAIYPGSFDPVTNGHLDIIRRSCKIFDQVNVVVMQNSKKKYVFSIEDRLQMLRECVAELGGKVSVTHFEGLLVDYCEMTGIFTVIRGLRALTDFDYEFQMALTNRKLNDKVDSVLFVTNFNYSYVSSSMVNEIASYQGDVSFMVPENVQRKLKEKYQ